MRRSSHLLPIWLKACGDRRCRARKDHLRVYSVRGRGEGDTREPGGLSRTDCTGLKEGSRGTSLVVQWLRIHLPMQGTRVRALIWEDPTCRGVTKPTLSYSGNKRSHCNEKHTHCSKE